MENNFQGPNEGSVVNELTHQPIGSYALISRPYPLSVFLPGEPEVILRDIEVLVRTRIQKVEC